MTYRWILREIDDHDHVATIRRELNDLPEALARALVLRGIDTFERARRFFRPSLDDLHDPFLMKDMEAAAERVAQAIRGKERVLVYGDYDVDGTTATALMTAFLRSQGVEATYFIPDRFEHGYGLCRAGIDQGIADGAELIIALDCGITAIEQAAYARKQGVDLIICDHHTAGDELPDALAVLDPKRPDCDYPFKELSGCGVGFKLVQATLTHLDQDPAEALQYLDLLAVSTASDIVPIHGENRILMREGLEYLEKTRRPGLLALAEQAGLTLEEGMTSSRIVFTLGPRINAAGRLGDASDAVALLLSDDADEAHELAQRLEALNLQRRTIDKETEREAIERAERRLSARMRHALVLHDEDWHQGVIGIVASRIVERFYRPTILLTSEDGGLKGSARSIAGVNIYHALKECEDLLSRFGGHDYAAGLSLPEENLPAFQKRFEEAVERVTTPEMLIPALEIDAVLDLDELDSRFWEVLKQFAPHGPSNMRPIFMARDLKLARPPRTVGSDDSHLKLKVQQRTSRNGHAIDVIGFGLGKHFDLTRESFDEGTPLELAFSVEENTWRGRTTLQLRARDVRLQKQSQRQKATPATQ